MTGAADEAPPAADPLVGAVFGERYRLDARLGGGGMGAVYRARHLALERDVAVKVLHAHLTEDPMVSRRFDREALASSKLEHRNCVQVLDTGTAEGGLKYLVMQLLDGGELRHAMKGPMPPERVVELTRQILLGLEHAHRRGLVHRDLKPENVFVVRDEDGEEIVKLVDFGIVKLISGDGSDEKLTRVGVVFGTPWYMSPEQAAGGKIDERTDLYAVGVLMYEMLAGERPFQADDMGMVLRMQLIADPPPLPDTVPAALRGVVMRLLEKDGKDRFASARATREALEAAASTTTLPLPAAAPTPAAAAPPPAAAAPPPPAAAVAALAEPMRGATEPAASSSGGRAPSSRIVFMRAEAVTHPAKSDTRGRVIMLAALVLGVLAVLGTLALAIRGCASTRTAAVVPPPASTPPSEAAVATPTDASRDAATRESTPPVDGAASDRADAATPPRERERQESDKRSKQRKKEEKEARKRQEERDKEARKREKEARKRWDEHVREGRGRGKRGRGH
jgi:hypothetical protein